MLETLDMINHIALTRTGSLASRGTGVCLAELVLRLWASLDLAVTVAGAGVAIGFRMVGAGACSCFVTGIVSGSL
jgi:hypothetical protein